MTKKTTPSSLLSANLLSFHASAVFAFKGRQSGQVNGLSRAGKGQVEA
jgi:hypothetical protein